MTEHTDHELLAEGTWGNVFGLRSPSGDCPSFDWLAGLTGRQQGGMRSRLDHLAEVGWLRTPDFFRPISINDHPVVYEVKHVKLNLRLYVIKGHFAYFATHGGTKPKKSKVAAEVERARSIFEECQT